MNSLSFTVSDLRSFFQENSDKPVGIPVDNIACPIATYFCRKRNMNVSVASMCIRDRMSAFSLCPLEPWQKRFVENLDSKFNHSRSVTGREAMEVLDTTIESVGGEFEL